MANTNVEVHTNLALYATPSDPKHLVPMQWVEQFFAGKVKLPVRAVSAANIGGVYDSAGKTLTLGTDGATVVDGITVAFNDRVLLIAQTAGVQNGIYVVTTEGAAGVATILTRASDFDASDKIFDGVRVSVAEGTFYADTSWKMTTNSPLVLDTTVLEFVLVEKLNSTVKFSSTITGDAAATTFNVKHDLGTSDVSVTIRNATTKTIVIVDWEVVDNNNIKIIFANAPTAMQSYRVTIIG